MRHAANKENYLAVIFFAGREPHNRPSPADLSMFIDCKVKYLYSILAFDEDALQRALCIVNQRRNLITGKLEEPDRGEAPLNGSSQRPPSTRHNSDRTSSEPGENPAKSAVITGSAETKRHALRCNGRPHRNKRRIKAGCGSGNKKTPLFQIKGENADT